MANANTVIKNSGENISYYTQNADALNAQYNTVDSTDVHNAWVHLLDELAPQARILDIGAGNGRDALYLEQRGFNVTAIEPSEALAAFGKSRTKKTQWLNDQLPLLTTLNTHNAYVEQYIKAAISEKIIADMAIINDPEYIKTQTDLIGKNELLLTDELVDIFLSDYQLSISGTVPATDDFPYETPYCFTEEDAFNINGYEYSDETQKLEFDFALPASFNTEFDLVLCSAVWMHIRIEDQIKAFSSLMKQTKKGGHFVISLRHGDFTDGRTTSSPTVERLFYLAEQAGVTPVIAKSTEDKLRRDEVSWSVLAFQK